MSHATQYRNNFLIRSNAWCVIVCDGIALALTSTFCMFGGRCSLSSRLFSKRYGSLTSLAPCNSPQPYLCS